MFAGIKKIFAYRDVGLLFKIFVISLKISFISSVKGESAALAAIPGIKRRPLKNTNRNKINKYVAMCVFIRRKLGFSDACLMHSILLCYMLREAGVEAKINFGVKKAGPGSITGLNSIGHCWVTVGNEKVDTDQKLIFNYP